MAYDSEPQIVDPAAPIDAADEFEGVDALPSTEDLGESIRKSYY
jgi:hypothetical protein